MKLCYMLIMRHRSMVKSEADNVMKAETRGLVTVVQVFAAARNWLGDLGFTAVVCKWERQLKRSLQSYLSR
jgi:hypothetical protein